ncbi:MAG TPA: BMP family protein [Armatimonadota bacterium]|jgi:basic membrane lipoprotein Med (substrate-binding protein (PBP1-ABC) superfamily)
MMKRFLLILGSAALLAGCTKQTPPTSAPGALKVALVTSGPVSDHGWNGLAHDAAQQLKKDTGAEVSEQEVKSEGEIEAALRGFASRGYDIILGHGNEYGEPAMRVAKDFPKSHFVITAGRVNAPNVTSLAYRLEDATYCLGVLAAGMSKTGRIACVGGKQISVVESTFNGLKAGVDSARPGTPVTFAYVDSWADTGAANRQTATLIGQGADVIFHNADAAGIGMFQAVSDANKAGKTVYALGSNADQTAVAPDVCLASAVLELGKTFEAVAQEVKANRFQGIMRTLGMKEGYVDVIFNPALKTKIPPAVLKKVEDAEKKIRSGALTVKQSA